MKITIEIPEEFEEHFYKDKFSGSLDRIINDIEYRLGTKDTFLAGNYEKEVIEMLKTAFEAVYVPECCANCAFFYDGYCIASNGMEFEREVEKTDHCSRWQKKL